jgi:type II secretory pathway component PulF
MTLNYAQPGVRESRRRRRGRAAGLVIEIGVLLVSTVVVLGLGALFFPVQSDESFSVRPPINLGGAIIASFILLACLSIAFILRAVRRCRSRIALQYIEQAIQQNLPLPAMLRAAAMSERGRLRRQLSRLVGYLESGASLAEACDRSLSGMPLRTVGLIGAAEELGVLPTTLARLVRKPQTIERADPVGEIYIRWYPFVLLFVIFGVWTVFTTRIAPIFKSLCRDFAIPVPTVSRIAWGEFGYLTDPLAILAILIAIFVASYSLSELLRPITRRTTIFKSLTDRVAWITPVWRRIVQARDLADVCQATASALAIGQPADVALLNAAQACGNSVMLRRVADWSVHVQSGASLHEAARQARLPRMLTGMLATASGPSGIVDSLRFLGRYYDSRRSAIAISLRAAAIPLLTLTFAVAVAVMVLGVFLPLIGLINALPGTGRVR